MKRHRGIMRHTLMFVVLLISAALIGSYIALNQIKIRKFGTFIVNLGDGPVMVGKKLEREDFLTRKGGILFTIVARINIAILNKSIKFGEYLISYDDNVLSLIDKFVANDVYYRSITIPEGLSIYQILQIFKNNEFLDGDLPSDIPEGTLMPDTYKFTYGDTKGKVIERMKESMLDFLNSAWQNRDPEIPLKSKEETLILASIIERESKTSAEKPRIASVIYNRLRIGMRLQMDSTVLYGITSGKYDIDRVLFHHLKENNEYNTYKIKGLPIGAISNPGRESILAALHPIKTDDLYFVLDVNGLQHIFLKKFSDHVNVANAYRYHSKSRKRKGSHLFQERVKKNVKQEMVKS